MALKKSESDFLPKIPQDNRDPFSTETQIAEVLKERGEELIASLVNCPPGNPTWQEYERICADILQFCLSDSIENLFISRQATSWRRHQRVDLLLKNRPITNSSTNYWNNLIALYGAREVIFECKNCTKGIEKEEVLQAKSYEWQNTGNVRFILTRVMPRESGIRAIRHWATYPQINFRVNVLVDEDLIKMIKARINNEPVEAVLLAAEDDERDSWYR